MLYKWPGLAACLCVPITRNERSKLAKGKLVKRLRRAFGPRKLNAIGPEVEYCDFHERFDRKSFVSLACATFTALSGVE